MTERCETCKFWQGRNESWAPCKRFPPTVPIQQIGLSYTLVSGLVCREDWCGEYKPKESADG